MGEWTPNGCEAEFGPVENITCAGGAPVEEKRYCRGTRFGNAFWLSSTAPLAQIAPAGTLDDVDYFQRVFQNVSTRVQEFRKVDHLRKTCSVEKVHGDDQSEMQRRWRNAALSHQKRIDIFVGNSSCFTESKLEAVESLRFWNRMNSFNTHVLQAGQRLLSESKSKSPRDSTFLSRHLSCWRDIFSPMQRDVATKEFQCTYAHVTGFRRGTEPGEKFNIGTSLTNGPRNVSLPEKERLYLGETWTVKTTSTGKRVLAAVPIPSYVHGRLTPRIENTTTAIFTWGGYPKATSFMDIIPLANPAILYVIETADRSQEAINDGVTWANIAIFVFPCLLGILPISVFVVTNNVFLLLTYAILTDVLTTLPLAIKGIEILDYSQNQHTRCVAWSVGAETDKELAIIEMWCANCTNLTKFRTFGIALTSLAALFCLTGLAFEFMAYRWQRKKLERFRNHRYRLIQEKKYWEQFVCTECKCDYSVVSEDISNWSEAAEIEELQF